MSCVELGCWTTISGEEYWIWLLELIYDICILQSSPVWNIQYCHDHKSNISSDAPLAVQVRINPNFDNRDSFSLRLATSRARRQTRGSGPKRVLARVS